MLKNLVRHGNSLALVIEKPILELLRAGADTPFEVTTDGRTLLLTPRQNENGHEAFDAALEKTDTAYASTLKRMSEK